MFEEQIIGEGYFSEEKLFNPYHIHPSRIILDKNPQPSFQMIENQKPYKAFANDGGSCLFKNFHKKNKKMILTKSPFSTI